MLYMCLGFHVKKKGLFTMLMLSIFPMYSFEAVASADSDYDTTHHGRLNKIKSISQYPHMICIKIIYI